MERSNGIMRLLVAATVAAILLLMSPLGISHDGRQEAARYSIGRRSAVACACGDHPVRRICDGHLARRFGDVPVRPLRFRGQFRFRRGATKAETEATNATQHPSRRSSGTKTTSETISKTAVPVVLAALAGMLLLAMVIVAVIVTVRFRHNPRGNARHLRR